MEDLKTIIVYWMILKQEQFNGRSYNKNSSDNGGSWNKNILMKNLKTRIV